MDIYTSSIFIPRVDNLFVYKFVKLYNNKLFDDNVFARIAKDFIPTFFSMNIGLVRSLSSAIYKIIYHMERLHKFSPENKS